jgi:hypothetical protein
VIIGVGEEDGGVPVGSSVLVNGGLAEGVTVCVVVGVLVAVLVGVDV